MFLTADVKILRGTDSKVIGLKFSGSWNYSYGLKFEVAFFQILGVSPAAQIILIIFVKYDRR